LHIGIIVISKKTALKSAILAATLAPAMTMASGYKINEQSASGVGNAYAGQAAMVEDASVVFYNPAGMVFLERPEFTGGFTYVSGDGKFSSGEGTNAAGQPIAAGDGTYSDGGDFLGSAFIPFMYYARPVSDKMAIGLGVFTPFGTNTDYDADFVGGGFADQTQLKSIDIQPSFAYKFSDELSVGFGIDIVYMKGLLSKQVDSIPYSAAADAGYDQAYAGGFAAAKAGGADDAAAAVAAAQFAENTVGFAADSPVLDPNNAGFENHYEVSGDDWGTGWNFGLMWKPTDSTTLGFAYRSEIEFNLEGDSEFADPFVAYDSDEDTLVQYGEIRKQASKVPLTTPQSATFSIAHQLTNNLMLQGGATWTGWSSFKHFDVIATENTSGFTALKDSNGNTVIVDGEPVIVPADGVVDISDISEKNGLGNGYIGHIVEEWNDVWAAALGASYQATPQVLLRAGYAYDQSPVTYKYRTARVPSSDRQWLTAGVQYKIDQDWTVDMGAAYLFMKEMELEEVNKGLDDEPIESSLSSVEGKYKINAFGLSFQVSYKM
jgi:long-chain fatty acid transport protein